MPATASSSTGIRSGSTPSQLHGQGGLADPGHAGDRRDQHGRHGSIAGVLLVQDLVEPGERLAPSGEAGHLGRQLRGDHHRANPRGRFGGRDARGHGPSIAGSPRRIAASSRRSCGVGSRPSSSASRARRRR
jgi:hypothetical protein